MGVGYFLFTVLAIHFASCQLTVNVRSQLGEVLKEIFTTNTTEDLVTLQLQLSDGTLITKTMDFKNKLQILRIIVLGEEELGQDPFQASCFIFLLPKGEFITSDAMSKLRQKNPRTIRFAETDLGIQSYDIDMRVNVELSNILSPHVSSQCADASATTFAFEKDLKKWASQKTDNDFDWPVVREITQRIPSNLDGCEIDDKESSPCLCTYQVMMPWYPCGLKYCKGKDATGKTVSYRCGIRTCRKHYKLSFYVLNKQLCIRNTEINVAD